MDDTLVILLTICLALLCFLLTYLSFMFKCLCSKSATDLYETRAHAEHDRHIIVQIPEEIEDSNPPSYSNFGPPDYEEAFDIFANSINLNIYQVV